jgi:hypothetical protein
MEYCGKKLRHELKYYINYSEYICLRNKLKLTLKHDRFADDNGNYFIRSLYFDDIYNRALFEKNHGVFERKKYRIRAYNLCDSVIKLECKSKYGEYISKESAGITRDEYYGIMRNDFSFLTDKGKGVLQEFYRQVMDSVLRPKVIVDYTREAYTMEAGDVRITFDKNLSASLNSNDIFGESVSTKQLLEPSIMILEVKFNDFIPQHIRQMLQISAHDRSAISKYVMCRALKNNIY